ncbi:MAG: TetR/AcrR family transcriptional regulator [Pseudomonadales bacterium]
MGRPSVTEKRAEEILDAFEVCVAKYGVEGATLEKIAEHAGLARALIRHHIGNRDELLQALLERFLTRSKRETQALFALLPVKGRAKALITHLFDSSFSDTQFALVTAALIAAAPNHEKLKPRLRTWVVEFTESVAREIQHSYPDADATDTFDVAAGIVGIYFNVESFMPLGRMGKLQSASTHAAERLISTLGMLPR